jgi:hypothetical protein
VAAVRSLLESGHRTGYLPPRERRRYGPAGATGVRDPVAMDGPSVPSPGRLTLRSPFGGDPMDPQTYCRQGCAALLAERGAGYDAMKRAAVLAHFATRELSGPDFARELEELRRDAASAGRSALAGAAGAILRDWRGGLEAPADGEAGGAPGGVSSGPAPTS